MQLLKIPENTKTLQLDTSIVWKDESGIIYSVPREEADTDYSQESLDRNMKLLREFIGNEKVCFVTVSNPKTRPPNREERDRVAEALNPIVKALAVVTTSPVSKMLANLFFGLKPPPYPTKMFTNADEAREWIKQYL